LDDTVIQMVVTLNEGYRFGYWQIMGGYTPGHSVAPLIIPTPPEGEPIDFPSPRLTVTSTFDSLTMAQNPLRVT